MTTENGISASNNAIEINDLTVAYHSKPALWDIDLSVPEGVLMAIVGPNRNAAPVAAPHSSHPSGAIHV